MPNAWRLPPYASPPKSPLPFFDPTPDVRIKANYFMGEKRCQAHSKYLWSMTRRPSYKFVSAVNFQNLLMQWELSFLEQSFPN